jgi:hypothetical protein
MTLDDDREPREENVFVDPMLNPSGLCKTEADEKMS